MKYRATYIFTTTSGKQYILVSNSFELTESEETFVLDTKEGFESAARRCAEIFYEYIRDTEPPMLIEVEPLNAGPSYSVLYLNMSSVETMTVTYVEEMA